MKKFILALYLTAFCFFTFENQAFAEVISPGSTVPLQNLLMPNTNQIVYISSGEVFSTQVVGNQAIQCKNADCSSYQKIIQTPGGFGIQGENYWDSNGDGTNEPNTTFQYVRNDGSLVPWLPTNMTVGQTYSTGAFNVVGYHIDGTQLTPFQSQEVAGMDLKLDYAGPVEFPTGITLDNVAIVKVMSGPGAGEVFYYAEGVGWVGWEGPSGNNYINQKIGNYYGPALKISKTVVTLNKCKSEVDNQSSRPAICDACTLPPYQTASCGEDFKVVDYVSYEKGEGDLCGEVRYTDQKSWGGILSIDPRNINLPFVGQKGKEDSTKFLADYFEGTNEYYTQYATPMEKENYTGVLQKLLPMEFQDSLKKQLIQRAVAAKQGTSKDPVHDYKVNYLGRTCWSLPLIPKALIAMGERFAPDFIVGSFKKLAELSDYCVYEIPNIPIYSWIPMYKDMSSEEAKNVLKVFNQFAPDFLDIEYDHGSSYDTTLTELSKHMPPDTKDPDFRTKWEAWKKVEDGKWFRLWQVTPFISREDSIGSIIPRPGLKAGYDTFEILNPKTAQDVEFPHLARLFEATKIVQDTLFPSQSTQKVKAESEPQLIASSDPTLLAQANTGSGSITVNATCQKSGSNYTVNWDLNLNSTQTCDLKFGTWHWGMNVSLSGGGSRGSGDHSIGLTPNISSTWYPGGPFEVSGKPGDVLSMSASVTGDFFGSDVCSKTIVGECNFTLTDAGCTGCGATVPVGPTCGLPETKQITTCQKNALPDSSGDTLCCGEIQAKLTAKEQFVNDQYIPCPRQGCDDRVEVEVSRPIEVNVTQPYLGQIWKNTGDKLGFFNIFRPATQNIYTEMDAIGKSKMSYTYLSQTGLKGKTVPTQGNLYFRYLGGIQLAKEAVLRVLSPSKK